MTEEEAKQRLEAEQRLGEEAQRILNSEWFARGFDDLRELYIADAVGAREPQERLDHLKALEVLEAVRSALGAALMAGKASSHMLDRANSEVV